jgi:translation initiation factor IF-1
MFRVALANEHLVLAHISGKMRKRFKNRTLTISDLISFYAQGASHEDPGNKSGDLAGRMKANLRLMPKGGCLQHCIFKLAWC